MTLTGAGTPSATADARGSARAHAPARPSAQLGAKITLADKVELSGYDAATTSAGTTYIGWIAITQTNPARTVYLCVLPAGASSCSGGVQSTPSLGDSSAADLRVLADGANHATLVWFHDTANSINGPNGSAIATASVDNGVLSAAQDRAAAPSFGSMLDAAVAPGNSIWAVTATSAATHLKVIPGLGNPQVSLTAPYMVGHGGIALTSSTAVLAIQKAGAISSPVSYAYESNGSWSGFHAVAHTWTAAANLGLARTQAGIRLLASVDNANYYPVVSRWTGSSFSRPQLTGDRNSCAPDSHDPVGDASGRMADVSEECANVTVANLTDTLHAGLTHFASGGTFAGGPPQITTTPRGRAWVVWSIESTAADKLIAAHLVLPARMRTVHNTKGGNSVSLTGPASCLPPIGVKLKVSGSPAAGWQVDSRALYLNGKLLTSTTLNGASLTAGKSYTLAGRVRFARNGTITSVTAQLVFLSCPNS